MRPCKSSAAWGFKRAASSSACTARSVRCASTKARARCNNSSSARIAQGSPHMTHQAILPEGWPRPKGYANGVLAKGRTLFIAGMIGWDAQGVFHTDDFAGQARQALQNIADVLR